MTSSNFQETFTKVHKAAMHSGIWIDTGPDNNGILNLAGVECEQHGALAVDTIRQGSRTLRRFGTFLNSAFTPMASLHRASGEIIYHPGKTSDTVEHLIRHVGRAFHLKNI